MDVYSTREYGSRLGSVFEETVPEVIDGVFHLKNSVAKHRPEEEFAAIHERIAAND